MKFNALNGVLLSTIAIVCGLSSPNLASAGANSPKKLVKLTPIATNWDGTVRNMGFHEAYEYCQNLGLRLPTAREWALWAVKHGARGISKVPSADYTNPVNGINYDGKRDAFNYSPVGYEAPTSGMKNNYFWTYTADPHVKQYAYQFSGGDGQLYNWSIYSAGSLTARCAEELP